MATMSLSSFSAALLSRPSQISHLPYSPPPTTLPLLKLVPLQPPSSKPNRDSAARSTFQCNTCKKAYCGNETHIDLIVASGAKEYGEVMAPATEFFRNLMLVRADISRLPFASSSIDAVHAGAALHCWPSPSTAVAEISRILRPGGVFVATTYILDGPFAALPLLKPLSQNFGRISGSHIFLADSELEELCNACGLVDFKCDRNRRFVMISATKPS
ncbi:hypothetical protein HYC85_020613 [Camellia sinensis]|uniref:Methyltransferase type 11 domain-containing protein n=1 Tax=Camellia sinensis TaxID=4442 RepID=A0A7J7GSS3_CAMSI|nr:hypothetical protein HYC85_020613 [Camellia sinensis]